MSESIPVDLRADVYTRYIRTLVCRDIGHVGGRALTPDQIALCRAAGTPRNVENAVNGMSELFLRRLTGTATRTFGFRTVLGHVKPESLIEVMNLRLEHDLPREMAVAMLAGKTPTSLDKLETELERFSYGFLDFNGGAVFC